MIIHIIPCDNLFVFMKRSLHSHLDNNYISWSITTLVGLVKMTVRYFSQGTSLIIKNNTTEDFEEFPEDGQMDRHATFIDLWATFTVIFFC